MDNDNTGQNCIFCQIAQGKIQSKIIYEDEVVVSFLDINPANKGHLLVIPKKHYSVMMQIPGEEIGYIFNIAQALSNALLKALSVDGTTIFAANGSSAGQRAPHFMLHIIPRFENDGLKFSVGETKSDENALEKLRQTIINIINGENKRPVETPKMPEKQPDKTPKNTQKNSESDVSLDDISNMIKNGM